MTRLEGIRLGVPLCVLIVAALIATAPAQGLRDIDIDPATLEWTVVDGTTSFAIFNSGGRSWYAVSRDGGQTAATVRAARPLVKLRYADFDPAVSTPVVPEVLRADDTSLFVVQYHTLGLEAYRAQLRALGAEVLHYVPHTGNLVRMDAATRATVETLSFVRWVGPYHPVFRIDAAMRQEILEATMPKRKYNVQVTRPGMTEKNVVADAITRAGGLVDAYVSPHGSLLTAELTMSQLLDVVRRDDVLFADPWSTEEPDLDIVRQFNGADFLESVGGYTGAGVRGQVRDSGLLFTHPDFLPAPPIPHNGTSGSTSHGTSVYGIVFGTGLNNGAARGICPDGQGIFHSSGTTVDRFVETGELLQDPYRCVFETNSTGSARTFDYTTISADMDNILFNHDVVVLQSQSNAGNQDSRPQAWAKNMLSVGGIRHFNTLTETDDAWNAGASIGPAADGRIKPDISAFYDSTMTTSDSGGYTTGFGGTSGATPITAGHMGLLHQMWADGIFGTSLVSWDVFENKPTATLAKALLLNSTTQYSFTGAADDLTRVHQGWGRPDVQRLWNIRDRLIWVDETDVLAPFGSTTHNVTVGASDPEFRATMVYRDPAGNPAASVHRINDLTLRVTDPMGTIYWGNNGLLIDTVSASGGTDNMLDTVEQVIVLSPMAGNWTVEVIAQEINQDSHVETGALDADYALVVSGVDPAAGPTPDTGQANALDASLSIVNALNVNGQKPNVGVNGPFFASLETGDALEFRFEGNANRPFLLFSGPLNKNNQIFGGIGSLDLGLDPMLLDVILLLDGVSGTTFFDTQARVGADGQQIFSFTLPPSIPPGVLGAFQALFWTVSTGELDFTAATEVTVQ